MPHFDDYPEFGVGDLVRPVIPVDPYQNRGYILEEGGTHRLSSEGLNGYSADWVLVRKASGKTAGQDHRLKGLGKFMSKVLPLERGVNHET